jgi:hypothetical protein
MADTKANVLDSEVAPAALSTTDDAAEAILKGWEDAEKLSEDETDATEETTSETEVEDSDTDLEDQEVEEEETEDLDEEETEETEEETQESEDDDETEEVEVEISDDMVVDIAVDGVTKQASIRDLKRLYGQESALTKKSQVTSQQKKLAEEQIKKTDATLQAMLSRAEEKYKPYSEVDMLMASKKMSENDFQMLRNEAKSAEDDVRFLREESNNFYDYIKTEQQKAVKQQAAECLKVLRQDIPDWSNDLYNDIRQYAIGSGLPEDAVNQYVDPNVIKLLNKARLYDTTKKVATKKKVKAKQKILRTKKALPGKTEAKRQAQVAHQERLRNAGSDMEAMADAILAGWEAENN